MLLIAGDMPTPEGAFDSTIGVLETGELTAAASRRSTWPAIRKVIRT